MRIVHVIRQFHPAVGGMESVARELAAAQVDSGHEVRVVTLNRVFKDATAEQLAASDIVDGAEVIRVPFFGSTRYPFAPSVIKYIRDADVVHVHAIDFFFDYLAWTKLLHRKKLVVSTHGGFFHTSYASRLKWLYFFTVTRLSLAWYDAVVAVSAADQELFSRIRKHGVVCIENGANVSKYVNASSPVPEKTILALGRLSSNKGLDRLIAFVAALHRHDPQWKLIIAGRLWDIEVHELTALADSYNVRHAVEIIIGPDDDKIRLLMARCSVIASASTYEGFGVAALEGMSAGLFPLLNDIPTFRQLIDRLGVGLLVDFSDVKAAVDRFIVRWRDIENDYSRYRGDSIAASSEYDWRRVSESYLELYECVRSVGLRVILDVPIAVRTILQTVELLDDRYEHAQSSIVAFANAHLLNIAYRDGRLRDTLQKSIVLNDGIGLDVASFILYGSAFPQNLNGTDFIPYYLRNTRHRYRVVLIGGHPGIAERAGKHFSSQYPQHLFVGSRHGYFRKDQTAEINAWISALKPDVILVGMGVPHQERWLAENLDATGCRLGFGVGALFDFASGRSPRAPLWVRSARLEWLHRLIHEPARLARRYIMGNPVFVFRVMGQLLLHMRARTVAINLPPRLRQHAASGKGQLRKLR